MAERETAAERLTRILAILPRAARAGGVPLAELAGELEIPEREVLRDLQEVYTREYYHPAGTVEDVQVLMDAQEVQVFTTGEFRRPSRLSPRETLALGLGLRVLAAEAPVGARPAMLALAERLESGVVGAAPERLLDGIAVNPGSEAPEGIRAMLIAAARERLRCTIAYLKPAAAAAEPRPVDPYVLIAASGQWYLVGFCHLSSDVRVFRADRVMAVEPLEEHFDLPDGFDPEDYVREGWVFRAGEEVEEVEVPVRYSPRIARWIEEQGPVERQEDGSLVVRHRVVDPGWLIRHVLAHAPEAEVLAPQEMRRRVRQAVRKIQKGSSNRMEP